MLRAFFWRALFSEQTILPHTLPSGETGDLLAKACMLSPSSSVTGILSLSAHCKHAIF